MRIEDQYIAEKTAAETRLLSSVDEAIANGILLEAQLDELRKNFAEEIKNAKGSASIDSRKFEEEKRKKTTDEYHTINTLLQTVSAQLETFHASTGWFGIVKNKMSTQDIQILTAQTTLINTLCTKADSEYQLSTLIRDTKNLTYKNNIWAKRAKFIAISVVTAVAVATLMTMMMFPAIGIPAAFCAIPLALQSLGSFFYLCKPATTSFNIPFLGSVSTPISGGSIGTMVMPVGYGIEAAVKSAKNSRASAAQLTQTATINELSRRLALSLEKKTGQDDVKSFLKTVINQATKMHNEGLKCFLYENQQSKIKKARMILEETAKIIEKESLPTSVNDLLSTPVYENKNYGDLLNAQRKTIIRRESSLWKAVKEETSTTLSIKARPLASFG